jgi:Secretion system C-terminal sorting domain/Carboxylesterase family
MKKLLFFFFLSMLVSATQAQTPTRYIDTTFFNNFRVDTTIRYGSNFSILAKLNALSPRTLRENLLMDVYSPPSTDTETKRPLVIFVHTGNFLPALASGPNGSRRDSTAVEFCRRLAKMGYVAASIDYRVGWAPTVSVEELRRYTLISAAYRGFQDLNTAVRFFKANAATYRIDSTKIVVWGTGSGSYITYAASNARDSVKFDVTTHTARKLYFGQNKMIQPWVNGDIDAKTQVIAPVNYWDTILKPIDTMCVVNHPANSSAFQMSVNMGGALGDLSWIDANSIPTISFQAPYDQFAPYQNDILNVQTPAGVKLPIIRVQGADSVQRKMTRLGLNKQLDKLKPSYNTMQTIFDTRNGGHIAGLFPLLGDTISDSWPWEYWATTNPRHAQGLTNNPRMSFAKAKRYMDTIFNVVMPRACVVLGLPCASVVSSTEELLTEKNTRLTLSPNPAFDLVSFQSDVDNPMLSIQIFDISGRLMQQYNNVKNHYFELNRNSLPDGMYIAKVKFEKGILAKKLAFTSR